VTNVFRVTLILRDGATRDIEVRPDEHILDAALASGIHLPYSCLQGWCLTCAARVLEGLIDQSDSRRFFPQDRAEGFALLCTGRALSDCVVETGARDAMRSARDRHRLPYPRGDWGRDTQQERDRAGSRTCRGSR
jgi:ferredoxin